RRESSPSGRDSGHGPWPRRRSADALSRRRADSGRPPARPDLTRRRPLAREPARPARGLPGLAPAQDRAGADGLVRRSRRADRRPRRAGTGPDRAPRRAPEAPPPPAPARRAQPATRAGALPA